MRSRPDWLEGNAWDSWDPLSDGRGISGGFQERYKQNDKLLGYAKLKQRQTQSSNQQKVHNTITLFELRTSLLWSSSSGDINHGTNCNEDGKHESVFLYCRPFLAIYWRICVVCSQDSSSCRAQEIFSKIDLDANGKLTQREFIKGCLKELNSSYYPNPSLKKWNQIRLSSLSLNIRTVTLLTFLARGE